MVLFLQHEGRGLPPLLLLLLLLSLSFAFVFPSFLPSFLLLFGGLRTGTLAQAKPPSSPGTEIPSPRAGSRSSDGPPYARMENTSPDSEGYLHENEQLEDNLPGSVSQEATAEHQDSQAKREQKLKKKVFTIQVLVTGRTGGCEDLFLENVSGRLSKIHLKTESYREDSGHFLLVFCPVSSRMGTDMQNALEDLKGEPKAVLIVLHHRLKEYDRFLDTTLQAHHPAVVRTVHACYTLEGGLYDCQMNEEAVADVAKVLKVHYKEMEKGSSDPAAKPPDSASQQAEIHRSERWRLKQKLPEDRRGQRDESWEPRKQRGWFSCCKKGFPIQVLVTGRTENCEGQFLWRVSHRLDKIRLKPERYREDCGHFLLVFCPVTSSVDIDMANALEGLHCEPEAILVMLHHKPKESTSFVDTTRQAQHRAVECTVHARYTLEDGFYCCQTNKEAVAIVAQVLEERRKMMKSQGCCY
ncbi:uncharacterized protein LOC103281588 isoform X2 [Anolis carolinensis]|uniref:uncharacterized protein LOC103281588 isoform X2 n=1 Tax=Anolis carolinensis TaxID=28377 RepID=UPI002F2B1864